MKKTRKRKINVYFVLGLLLVLFGVLNLIRYGYTEYRFYKSLNEIAQVHNELKVSEESGLTRNEALIKRNEDMEVINLDYVGWVSIKYTNIDFPFMITYDNEYYLNHNYKREKHAFGSIYMDYRNTSKFTEEHIILYGHSVNTKAMFGPLDRYKDEDYLADRNIIEIVTSDRILEYQIFSIQVVDADVIILDNPSRINDINELYTQFKAESLYDIEDVSTEVKQIITLVSCEYSYENGRILVHALLINEQNLK